MDQLVGVIQQQQPSDFKITTNRTGKGTRGHGSLDNILTILE
jgi:hypothetical protein